MLTKNRWITLMITGLLLLSLAAAALPAQASSRSFNADKPVKTQPPGSGKHGGPLWKLTPQPGQSLENDKPGKDDRGPKDKGQQDPACADASQTCEPPTGDPNQPCADASQPCEQPPADQPADDKPGKGPQDKHLKKNLNATVTEINGDQVTLTLKDGSTVTVTLNENTAIRVPGGKGPAVLEPGERLVVRTVVNDDGSITIAQAKVIPGKPERIHRVGVVTAYEPGVSITVMGKDGQTTTFTLAPGAKMLSADGSEVQVGSTVTIISPRMFTGGPIARGIVVHPQPVTPDEGEQTPCEQPAPCEGENCPEQPAPCTGESCPEQPTCGANPPDACPDAGGCQVSPPAEAPAAEPSATPTAEVPAGS